MREIEADYVNAKATIGEVGKDGNHVVEFKWKN